MPPDPLSRVRRRRFAFKDKDIVDRVLKFFEDDNTDRAHEKEARLQRYAKYRMWVEEKDWPWENAANIPLSDIMEVGLRMDDTLHNAVMSSRPVINAAAVDERNAGQTETIDRLIDYQFFVEQMGEKIVGDMANAFSTDSEVITFVPWVKEMRESSDSRRFDPIPPEIEPQAYFQALMASEFPGGRPRRKEKGRGWDWRIEGGKPIDISFYAEKEDGPVEMVVRREVVLHDGPLVIQKEWEDVLYPARAANLHIPGPSNPHGAGHVILVDYPSLDEINRLARDGTYDRLKKETLDRLNVTAQDADNREMQDQKDNLQGTTKRAETSEREKKKPQRTLTRLTCFDVYDARGNGRAEDMVWTVIKEAESLARARVMSESFPSTVPRRPIEHEAFIPVRGRVSGIGIPELLEGLHDASKQILDQTVDGGTLKIAPPWFYRPFGGMNPETVRLAPGEGYPLGDPTRDVNFPTVNTQAETMGLNLVAILHQMKERVSVVGDLQLGRVPQGKASALRTVGGMSLIAGQGEARPERILRRFFSLLARIYAQIHERNRFFLPDEKKIRVLGLKAPSDDPYLTIRRKDIDAEFLFDFKANVLNTSKEALQQGLQQVMAVGISSIAIQLGITRADGLYRLLRDHAKAWGQDPDQYYSEPVPGADKRRIFAEEAISTILDGILPDGLPAEGGGAAEHLQKLAEFFQSDGLGLIRDPATLDLLKGYMQDVAELAAFEQRQAQLALAAGEFGGGAANGQPGRPPEGPPANPNEPTALGPGELLDETLPGAGGGANNGIGLGQ